VVVFYPGIGADSVVNIVIRLLPGRLGVIIVAVEIDFSLHQDQQTVSVAHPVSYSRKTGVIFCGKIPRGCR